MRECTFFPLKLFSIHHSEEVLPSIHADKYYPCELVGTWNTWYGEQDQAGRITYMYTHTSAVQQRYSGLQIMQQLTLN